MDSRTGQGKIALGGKKQGVESQGGGETALLGKGSPERGRGKNRYCHNREGSATKTGRGKRVNTRRKSGKKRLRKEGGEIPEKRETTKRNRKKDILRRREKG